MTVAMHRLLSIHPRRLGTCLLALGSLLSCAHTQAPAAVVRVEYGLASWYGEDFHGKQTASGEVYNMYTFTAAHRSAPLGSEAIVTNLETMRKVRVRINDRGPFVDDRILDLSYAAARRLDMVETGVTRVKVRFIPETRPAVRFVVQAGAYQEEHSAVRVQRDLADSFAQVWVIQSPEGADALYRVRLGPYPNRPAAEHAARRVDALGYSSLVVALD